MKLRNYISIILLITISVIVGNACKKSFLDKTPYGPTPGETLANKSGVDGLLIGAYSLLDGVYQTGQGNVFGAWESTITNWIYGSVASDDAHKGSEYGDQPEIEPIEAYRASPVSAFFNDKWRAVYAGVQRTNDVFRLMRKVTDGSLTPADTMQIAAETRFLRALYHFEAVRMWGSKVPYVDESISYENNNFIVGNDVDIYPKIEADLQFAAANLTPTKPQFGRVNSWAAKALLGKVLMQEHKYAEALPILRDVINNGVNSAGTKYALVANFSDNFNPSTQNNSETVFAVQMSVLDNSQGYNGNLGDILNFPSGGPASCCGFFQPSFDLANAFKVDAAGLPLLTTYSQTNLKNDMGVLATDPFTPSNELLDPRIDWTIGRRGIPYLDWGVHPGAAWVRAQAAGGPYSPVKNIYWKKDQPTTSDQGDGWAANQATANNYNYLRFADVLLLAAEAEVEAGSLSEAERFVNIVRERASHPTGFVHTYVDNADPSKGFTDIPAANYRISQYPPGTFAANGKELAREAVRFERRLEFAMEGQRFFDLQRYDGTTPGYMSQILNGYITKEVGFYPPATPYRILQGAKFTQGQDEVFPIPQAQIDISNQLLKPNQNTGG